MALVAWVLWAAPASAQWQIESKDGKANLKIGFLAQPQLETLETADEQATSANLFIRRLRLLFGGAVSERWSFFIETDSPNIGKGNPSTGATPASRRRATSMCRMRSSPTRRTTPSR